MNINTNGVYSERKERNLSSPHIQSNKEVEEHKEDIKKEKLRKYHREYYHRPEVHEKELIKKRKYYHRPEVKARLKKRYSEDIEFRIKHCMQTVVRVKRIKEEFDKLSSNKQIELMNKIAKELLNKKEDYKLYSSIHEIRLQQLKNKHQDLKIENSDRQFNKIK